MAREIIAPLAGKVFQLQIKVGEKVEEDQEILVIEAMKMETPVYTPCDGTVKQVNVKEGDKVEAHDVLVIVDQE